LKQNTDTFDKVEYLNFGVWSEETILKFEINDDKSSLIYEREKNENLDNFEVNVDKIDNIAHDATFIKMDVEGAEYQALIGAVDIIKRNKPKLAISIYHNQSDLFRIFELINQMRNDYIFYFRLHNKLGVDAMLYAL
jgi:FkbM family methyltransferase